jgi:Dolichyl-phosphate-mannose-protein mannosyltransferase
VAAVASETAEERLRTRDQTLSVVRSPAPMRDWLVLAAIVVAGVLLRLPSLGNSLFGDELSSYFVVTSHSLGGIVRLLDGHSVELTPPLYFLLAHLITHLGNSVVALRAAPMLGVTAAIPLTYLVGVRTVGRRAALTGSALMALSPFLIFYGTEARAYGVVIALALGSTLCLLIALERHRAGWWFGYAVLACASVYTHYTAAFVLVAQFLWAAATHPTARRRLLLASVAALAGFAPWIPALVTNSHSFGTKVFEILEPFGPHAVAHDLARFSLGHPYLSLYTVPGRAGLALIAAGFLVALAALAERATVPRLTDVGRLLRSPALLPVLLTLATPVGLVLYSVLRQDTWDMRNLATSWPWLALSAGALLAAPRAPARYVCTALTVAGVGAGAVELLSSANQRPDYRAAARLIETGGPPSDPVAIVPVPTPGPLAAMDAALAYVGQPNRPLIRIGSPPLPTLLRARPYAVLAPTAVDVLARQAAAVPPGSRLFVVAPGRDPLAALLRTGRVDPVAVLGPNFGAGDAGRIFAPVFVPLSAFFRDVSPDFVPVQTRVLPGFLPLSVYVLVRR